jgi:hypothetical protein
MEERMTELSYVSKLIELYTAQVERLIEEQNPELATALSMVSSHIEGLKQARNRCTFDDQLYHVNRISRILGEIEGDRNARQEAAKSEKAREEALLGKVRDQADG